MSTNSGKTILTIALATATLLVGLNYLTGADSGLLPLLLVLIAATVAFAAWVWSDENKARRAGGAFAAASAFAFASAAAFARQKPALRTI